METNKSQSAGALADLELLDATFRGPSGLVAEDLRDLIRVERLHGEALVKEVQGFTCLLDCFQAFVVCSFGRKWQPDSIQDLPQLCQLFAAFRAFRASYCVLWSGYYFEAAADLRTVGDSVLILAALAKGILPRDTAAYLDKNAISKATTALLGENCGLSEQERGEIKYLHETLGLHVHGSKLLSATLVHRATKHTKVPSIKPYFDLGDASHYCQVSACMAWGLHRVLWTIRDRPDGQEWRHQYTILDTAFRSYVADWDKPVARAYSRWVDLQLSFPTVASHITGPSSAAS